MRAARVQDEVYFARGLRYPMTLARISGHQGRHLVVFLLRLVCPVVMSHQVVYSEVDFRQVVVFPSGIP